jgi:hypothetical protein
MGAIREKMKADLELRGDHLGAACASSDAAERGTVGGGWAGRSVWGSQGPGAARGRKRVRGRGLVAGLAMLGVGLGLGGAAVVRARWSGGRGGAEAAGTTVGGLCEAEPVGLVPPGEIGAVALDDLAVVRPASRAARDGGVRGAWS